MLELLFALFIGDTSAKDVNDSIKATAPKSQKFYHLEKLKELIFLNIKIMNIMDLLYSFVAKNSKSKGTIISVLYMTDKALKDAELDKVVDKTLNEIESFLK